MNKFSLMVAALAAIGLARAEIQPITGTNTVGFVSVAAPGNANSIITVPFEACLGNGSEGMLADLVSTNGLTPDASSEAAADQLVVLTTNATAQLVYYYYWYKTGHGWTAIDIEKLLSNGSTQVVTPPAATNFPIARGLGFWLKRVAGAGAGVYLKGQVTLAKQSTLINQGLNLIGYSAAEAFLLNSKSWTGASAGANGDPSKMDKIFVNNGNGTLSEYMYFVKAGHPLNNKWVMSTGAGPVEAGVMIPAGAGFWFQRRAGSTFYFQPDGI